MKTIGLIGGTTWHSTAKYYQLLNEGANTRLGGTHSARIVLDSVEFAEFRAFQDQASDDKIADYLVTKANGLRSVGTDIILLCANTLHKYYDAIQEKLDIPILHIADALGEELERFHVKRPGILGTAITMYEPFYRHRLSSRYQMEPQIPEHENGEVLSQAIYQDLSRGEITDNAQVSFENSVEDLIKKNADAVVLGCTELYMLRKLVPESVKVFDTLDLHVKAALNWAIDTNE